jgi:hypothetical protein
MMALWLDLVDVLDRDDGLLIDIRSSGYLRNVSQAQIYINKKEKLAIVRTCFDHS